MGWLELIVVAFFVPLLLGYDVIAWFGSECPECRQARLRKQRELGELWGESTRFSTCPACGHHFRHEGARLVKTGMPLPATDDAACRQDVS